jgi:hypothetical protein
MIVKTIDRKSGLYRLSNGQLIKTDVLGLSGLALATGFRPLAQLFSEDFRSLRLRLARRGNLDAVEDKETALGSPFHFSVRDFLGGHDNSIYQI